MASNLKRMTFVVTPELEVLLDDAKKEFYNRSNSEMIRELVIAGLGTVNNQPNMVEQQPPEDQSQQNTA